MNWKKNQYLVIALGAALLIAIVIIAMFMWPKNDSEDLKKQVIEIQQKPQQKSQPEPNSMPKDMNMIQDTPVGNGKPSIVLFYADKCSHSKNMLPSWQQMSQTLAQTGQIDAISLELNQYPHEMKKNGIEGYPTIRFYPEGFPGGKFIDYRGNRTTESLLNFARSGGQNA